ncbi:serine/threonine protein kinase [Diaporthe helianthi]|uniref:Serine/threonine protein kinase n=1 Tax=Diaporthe helianthi TaxID=158607 RepID=A0A2P5HGU7_DIAHE|nr:serine/threonine protein kinase [Diaporthe helianthi]
MAALFQTEQVLIGQVGKYRIVKQLQKAVWLARDQAHKDVIVKSVQGHPRVANERDVLKIFTPLSKCIRPLLDEIVDPAKPTTIVLSHLQSTLLQSSVRKKLNRTELKHVCHSVLEALAVIHSKDVKSDNILVNEESDETNRFTDVQLADMGNSYPETHEYALEGQPIGAPMWSSPELISLIYGHDFNIFDPPDVLTDPIDDYKFAVLRRQVEIFGPFPVKYQEIANEDVMELIVWMLENLKESRTPFQSITDREISQEDKDFISWIMKLDPRDRPTAAAILSHDWWQGPTGLNGGIESLMLEV